MSDEDDESTTDENACPFCASTGGCEHLLLLVDLTFRTSDGGALFEAFGDRWGAISDREDNDFDEGVTFNDLLEEVDSLSDDSLTYIFEGGPGMTSEYGMYFCSSRERVESAVKRFEVASAAQADLEGDRCPLCQKTNAPASGDTCEHQVGWKWDGTFELDADLEGLHRSWQEAGEHLRTLTGTPDFDVPVAGMVGGVAQRQKLVDLASDDADFSDLLDAVGVSAGGGWQTRGMLGGSGYNLYTDDLQSVKDATALYDGVCELAEHIDDKALREKSPPVVQDHSGRKRPVLIIVTQWPSGTMAMKFGYALRSALHVLADDRKIVQMEPERIFRAETEVSEEEFRTAMNKSGVSCPGRLLFIEL